MDVFPLTIYLPIPHFICIVVFYMYNFAPPTCLLLLSFNFQSNVSKLQGFSTKFWSIQVKELKSIWRVMLEKYGLKWNIFIWSYSSTSFLHRRMTGLNMTILNHMHNCYYIIRVSNYCSSLVIYLFFYFMTKNNIIHNVVWHNIPINVALKAAIQDLGHFKNIHYFGRYQIFKTIR